MVVRFCDDRRLLEKDFLGKQKGDLSSPDKMKAPFLFSPKTRFHFSFSSFRFRKGDSLSL